MGAPWQQSCALSHQAPETLRPALGIQQYLLVPTVERIQPRGPSTPQVLTKVIFNEYSAHERRININFHSFLSCLSALCTIALFSGSSNARHNVTSLNQAGNWQTTPKKRTLKTGQSMVLFHRVLVSQKNGFLQTCVQHLLDVHSALHAAFPQRRSPWDTLIAGIL